MNLFKTIIPGVLLLLSAGIATAKLPEPSVGCVVETERSVLPAGKAQTTIIKVTLDAPPPLLDEGDRRRGPPPGAWRERRRPASAFHPGQARSQPLCGPGPIRLHGRIQNPEGPRSSRRSR